MRRPLAFTLVEILVVLAIIAVLAALTISGVQYATKYAHRSTCISNLRQLVTALKMYDQNWGGPPPLLVAHNTWDKVQPEIKPVLLCPADFSKGELLPGTLKPKHGKWVHSSYSPFYFMNELDCSGRLDQPSWAPLPDAERIWFICRWHAPHPWLYAYADGHVEWANEFLPGQSEGRTAQYIRRLKEVCPNKP
ncbi:MAG: type II secretion system protein [Chthonomonadetes bacterium]|nr:type II secretion system protein [Chthonomonadetes bacterium]